MTNTPSGVPFTLLGKTILEQLQRIEEAKKTMSEAEFNQEYMADFNVFEGQIWKFDYENCSRFIRNGV